MSSLSILNQPVFVAGLVFSGLVVLVAPLQNAEAAAAPGYKVSMVNSAVSGARESVENGENPQQDCTMVSMQAKSIITDHADDTEAVAVAVAAMEVCGVELPVTYFGNKLDAVQAALSKNPEAPEPCNDFVSDFTVYFATGGSALPGGADPEEQVKAALSERMHEVCPFAAGMMKF